MDKVTVDLLMRTYDMYMEIAKENVRVLDKSKFRSKVFYASDGSGKFIITPPLVSIDMDDYGDPFCGIYMTRSGKLWVEMFGYKQNIFRPYRNKKDRDLVYEHLSNNYSSDIYRPCNGFIGMFGILCRLRRGESNSTASRI